MDYAVVLLVSTTLAFWTGILIDGYIVRGRSNTKKQRNSPVGCCSVKW
jgi:hypothetical protein